MVGVLIRPLLPAGATRQRRRWLVWVGRIDPLLLELSALGAPVTTEVRVPLARYLWEPEIAGSL